MAELFCIIHWRSVSKFEYIKPDILMVIFKAIVVFLSFLTFFSLNFFFGGRGYYCSFFERIFFLFILLSTFFLWFFFFYLFYLSLISYWKSLHSYLLIVQSVKYPTWSTNLRKNHRSKENDSHKSKEKNPEHSLNIFCSMQKVTFGQYYRWQNNSKK